MPMAGHRTKLQFRSDAGRRRNRRMSRHRLASHCQGHGSHGWRNIAPSGYRSGGHPVSLPSRGSPHSGRPQPALSPPRGLAGRHRMPRWAYRGAGGLCAADRLGPQTWCGGRPTARQALSTRRLITPPRLANHIPDHTFKPRIRIVHRVNPIFRQLGNIPMMRSSR